MTTSLPVFGGGSGLDCRIGGPGSADSILLLLSALFLADGLWHLAALEVGHVVRLQVLQVERLTVGQLENMSVKTEQVQFQEKMIAIPCARSCTLHWGPSHLAWSHLHPLCFRGHHQCVHWHPPLLCSPRRTRS